MQLTVDERLLLLRERSERLFETYRNLQSELGVAEQKRDKLLRVCFVLGLVGAAFIVIVVLSLLFWNRFIIYALLVLLSWIIVSGYFNVVASNATTRVYSIVDRAVCCAMIVRQLTLESNELTCAKIIEHQMILTSSMHCDSRVVN